MISCCRLFSLVRLIVFYCWSRNFNRNYWHFNLLRLGRYYFRWGKPNFVEQKTYEIVVLCFMAVTFAIGKIVVWDNRRRNRKLWQRQGGRDDWRKSGFSFHSFSKFLPWGWRILLCIKNSICRVFPIFSQIFLPSSLCLASFYLNPFIPTVWKNKNQFLMLV